MSNANWKNNQLQFARLLSEIQASKLTSEQYKDLSESMDLSFDEIDKLLQRATDAFEHLTNIETHKELVKQEECAHLWDNAQGQSYCIRCEKTR